MTKVRDLEQVIDVAARLFGERGYEATRLDDIASELGILKGSLYYYTSGKAELLRLVQRRRLAALIERATAIAESNADVEDKLGGLLRELLLAIHEFSPESSQWFVQSEARPNRDSHHLGTTVETAAMHRDYEGIIQGVIEEGRRSGRFRDDIDIRVATLGVLGACNWLMNWYRRGGRLSIDEISDSLLGMLLAGLRAPAERSATLARGERRHSAR